MLHIHNSIAEVKLSKLHFVILFFLASLIMVNAQSGYTFVKYAAISNGSGELFVLEYGYKSSGYNGYIKWRLTNNSNTTVYNISIADKVYTMTDGRSIGRSGETISSRLSPGESKSTYSDAVNSDEHGGFGAVSNPASISQLRVERPMIRFSLQRNGSTQDWADFGRLIVY